MGAARIMLAGAAASISVAIAHAQPATPAAAPDEEIVVTGSRGDPVAAFVEAVTVDTDEQIARFATPICPISLGLPPGHGEFIEGRIRQVADHLGIGSAGSDCLPNVIVIVADQGGDFVQRLRRERPELFAALELSDVRRVMRLSGPVRAWQVVEPHGADGRPMERIGFLETGPGQPPRPVVRAHVLNGVMPSLTQRPTRQDLSLSFIVFDLEAIEGLTLLQIADHAAIRALARTEAALLPPGRSILTVFRDRDTEATAGELTDWDAAYLRALYRTANVVTAHQQRSSVARTMRRELASER